MCRARFLSCHLLLDILSNNQSLSLEGSPELWGNVEKGDPIRYQDPDGTMIEVAGAGVTKEMGPLHVIQTVTGRITWGVHC